MALGTSAGPVANTGDARWITEPQATVASTGAVRLADEPLPATAAPLDCGDGVALPVAGTAAPTSEPPPTQTTTVPSLTAPPSSSTTEAAPDPTRNPRRDPTTRRPNPPNNPPNNPPTRTPTTTPTTPSATPSSPTTTPTTPTTPPPDRTPPSISVDVWPGVVYDEGCSNEGPYEVSIDGTATDTSGIEWVTASASGEGGVPLNRKGPSFSGSFDPDGSYDRVITVTVEARDGAGNTASVSRTVRYVTCVIG